MTDIIGNRYGRLIVVEKAGSNKFHQVLWRCKCDCGKEITTTTARLNAGKCRSCGCLKAEGNNRKHGMCYTRINHIYRLMKQRCYSESNRRYADYGGRGICVCDEWLGEHGFQHFQKWAYENGYQDNLSIDRIDNDGNYEPSNCRWVDAKVQGRNTRRNIQLTLNGETHTLAEWSELTGIPYAKLRSRVVQLKWDAVKALEMEAVDNV